MGMMVSVGKVRVLVADKNALICEGISALLQTREDIEVVGSTTTSGEIIDMVKEHIPDVLLTDISVLTMDSPGVIRQIRKEKHDIRILFVTEHEDRDNIMTELKAGCDGYILRRATLEDLVTAILAVHRGGYFLYPSVAKLVVNEYLHVIRGQKSDPFDRLSEREIEVLKLTAEGYRSQQIAESLSIAHKTVLRHRSSIMMKLDVHNQTDLVKYAIRKHLTQLE